MSRIVHVLEDARFLGINQSAVDSQRLSGLVLVEHFNHGDQVVSFEQQLAPVGVTSFRVDVE